MCWFCAMHPACKRTISGPSYCLDTMSWSTRKRLVHQQHRKQRLLVKKACKSQHGVCAMSCAKETSHKQQMTRVTLTTHLALQQPESSGGFLEVNALLAYAILDRARNAHISKKCMIHGQSFHPLPIGIRHPALWHFLLVCALAVATRGHIGK